MDRGIIVHMETAPGKQKKHLISKRIPRRASGENDIAAEADRRETADKEKNTWNMKEVYTARRVRREA